MKLKAVWAVAALAVLIGSAAGWLALRNGAYGFNVIARRGGTIWINTTRADPRLSPSMRRALETPPPEVHAGAFAWREAEPGFEIAEMPVMAGEAEVDRILLSRIDPARYRFVARNAPAGDKGIDEWERALPTAVLIVNGSYFGRTGTPDTPFISEGTALGPKTYDARAGALVAGEDFADVKDLTHQTWQTALAGADNAMVAYPLLIGDDGESHVTTRSRWLANRTFVAKDGKGRIIIGTTKEAFFPLVRLAEFLRASPLDLRTALNLDGGPIACQSVRLKGFSRKFYARWEAQVDGDKVRLLTWPLAKASWAMPVVLTVERR